MQSNGCNFHSNEQIMSQWPRGLMQELSSPAQTLGSCVGIPLEAWMSLCVYSVCVVLRVGRGPETG
jgi:hypothetical protein